MGFRVQGMHDKVAALRVHNRKLSILLGGAARAGAPFYLGL